MANNILGISLGSRLLGMAVLYDSELCDYRVRTFCGPWTDQKRREMIAAIRKTVQRYGITTFSVKTPGPSHCSPSIRALMSDIQALSVADGINLSVCTIAGLKSRQNGLTRANKMVLMEDIVRKYGHHRVLAELLSRERKNHSAYHVKLFEAIACTELA